MDAVIFSLDKSTKSDSVIEIDAAAQLSWQLVKIVKDLPIADQRRIFDFAKSLRDQQQRI